MAALSMHCARSLFIFSSQKLRWFCTQGDSHTVHVPVMLKECLSFLAPRDGQVFIDATFGSGGHTAAILMSAKCKVYAMDRDPAAVEIARILSGRTEFKGRMFPAQGKFSEIYRVLKSHGVKNESFDGMLLDIGASTIQFEDPVRGFSFYKNGPLDMRMDVRNSSKESSSGERLPMTAADVVNSINETELIAILRQYGQEKEAVRISRAIVRARSKMPIVSTRQLAGIVTAAVRNIRTDRFSRQLHPAARTFQALRILVNDELNELQYALKTAHKLLRPGGRLVVISFHALEDSIVRHFFKETLSEVSYLRSRTKVAGKAKTSSWLPLHKKVIYPTEEEVYLNPRSRSARLRAAVKADNLVLDLTELTNLLDNNPGQSFYNGSTPQ
ncbi:ribosomal RNA small subunit methyltransferase H-like [Montipora foliosa]|uniref:ribosomal RNA small subunit methyltransferase H-like n=1 Tax=Montipora foliosa TaxID=591990 RepID=UPI0035F1C2CD